MNDPGLFFQRDGVTYPIQNLFRAYDTHIFFGEGVVDKLVDARLESTVVLGVGTEKERCTVALEPEIEGVHERRCELIVRHAGHRWIDQVVVKAGDFSTFNLKPVLFCFHAIAKAGGHAVLLTLFVGRNNHGVDRKFPEARMRLDGLYATPFDEEFVAGASAVERVGPEEIGAVVIVLKTFMPLSKHGNASLRISSTNETSVFSCTDRRDFILQRPWLREIFGWG